jgi:hypothetical protein
MTGEPDPKPQNPACNFCGYVDSEHEGGLTMHDGTEYQGFFCDELCFNKWRIWKSAFHEHLIKQREKVNAS